MVELHLPQVPLYKAERQLDSTASRPIAIDNLVFGVADLLAQCFHIK